MPASQAQGIFFGMMSEQTPMIYSDHIRHQVTEEQTDEMFGPWM